MSVEFLQRYGLWMFIAFAAIWYFFGFMAFRVQEDARKRGMSKTSVTFWSVSVVFFGPIFLPLYYIFRSSAVFAAKEDEIESRVKTTLCPHCGETNPADRETCRNCKKPLDPSKTTVGTKACPYCGAENPVDSSRCSSCDQVIGFGTMSDEEGEE